MRPSGSTLKPHECHIGVKIDKTMRARLAAVADGRPISFVTIRALTEFLEREEAKQ